MAKKALNSVLAKSCETLKSKGLIGPSIKHDWEKTRHILWESVKTTVLPEFGIKPVPANAEEMENLKNARKAFDAIIDSGYCCESSNLGKHLVDHGYARPDTEADSPSGEQYV